MKEKILAVINKYPTPNLKNYTIEEFDLFNNVHYWRVEMCFNGKFPQGRSFECDLKDDNDIHNFELKIREVLRLY